MHQTLGGVAWGWFWSWVTTQGRFFPGAFYHIPLFYMLDGNRLVYKLLILSAILANLALFSYFIRRVTRSNSLCLLAVIMPTLAFQFMYFHDSLLGFSGLLQLVWLLFTLSLISFVKYLDSGRRMHLVLSVTFYVWTLLTYEIVIPFVLLFVPLAIWYPQRREIRPALAKVIPLAAASACSVLIALALRFAFHVGVVAGTNSGTYQLSLEPVLVLGALAKQLAGAVPLAYYTLRVTPPLAAAGVQVPTPAWYVTSFPLTSIMVFLGYTALIAVAMVMARREPAPNQEGHRGLVALAWMGPGLFILPAALMSLSSKWQGTRTALNDALAWGIAYLPVYISYFGVAVILSLAVYWAARASRTTLARTLVTVALAMALAGVGVVNFQTNRMTVSAWGFWRFTRDVATNAVSRGVLGAASPGSLLALKQSSPWDTQQFYAGEGVDVSAVTALNAVLPSQLAPLASSLTTEVPGPQMKLREPSHAFMVESAAAGRRDGYVLVSEIVSARFDGEKLNTISTRPVALYIETPFSLEKATDSFLGSPLDAVSGNWTPESLGFAPTQASKTAAGRGWALYELHSDATPDTPVE